MLLEEDFWCFQKEYVIDGQIVCMEMRGKGILFFISFAYFIKKSMENVYAFFDSIIEPFYMEWSYAFASWNDTYIFHLPFAFRTEKGRNGDQMVYDTRTGAKKEIFFIFCP